MVNNIKRRAGLLAMRIIDLIYNQESKICVHHDGIVIDESIELWQAYQVLRKSIPSYYRYLLHDYRHVASTMEKYGDYVIILPTGTPMGLQIIE